MVNMEKLKVYAELKGWGSIQLSRELELDYSYVYRLLNGTRNGGKKLYEGVIKLCRREGLDFDEFFKEFPEEALELK